MAGIANVTPVAKPRDGDRILRVSLPALLTLAAFRFWVMPLNSSLWLDETGTYWCVKDGLSTALKRAFSGQVTSSPIYLAVQWLFLKIPGPLEVRLRLPSAIAILLSLALLYQLGRRLSDHETGVASVCVFVSLSGVIFAGADARPYALWLLVTIAACLTLIQWMDSGRPGPAACFAVLAGVSTYIHYLAGAMWVVYAVYILARTRAGSPVRRKQLFATAIFVAMAQWPLIGTLWRLQAEPNAHYYMASTPDLRDLEALLAPPSLIVGLFGGLLLGRLLFSRISLRAVNAPRSVWILLAAWGALPVLTLFGISVFSGAKLFHPRYLICAAPALAVLTGLGIRCLEPAGARIATAGSILLVALMTYGGIRHLNFRHQAGENWRGAMETVASYADGNTPVLVQSGFPESRWPDWQTPPSSQGQLFAPLSAYPIISSNVIPLPMTPDGSMQDYLARVVSERLGGSQRFLLATVQTSYKFWLDGRLNGIFASRAVGPPEAPQVFLYERVAGTRSR